MTRVKILRKKLNNDEIEKLKLLAVTAGYVHEEIELLDTISEPDVDCDDEVILVLASRDTCADPDLEKELAKTPNGGRRAVCVWPEGAEPSELPAAVMKYCYSIIPWNAEKLQAVAADDDIMCFESATGEPLPKVETERNLCVEEGKSK
jgi:hypothetical protein